MTEEAKVPEQTQEPEVKSDPIEELAAELGWNKDYEGENKVDAKTYIKRSKEINQSQSKKNKNLTRELEALKEGLAATQKHYETIRKRDVERLESEIKELKAKRDAAAEQGDHDNYKQANAKIERLETEKEKVAKTEDAKPAGKNELYIKWVDDGNSWYEEDDEMRAWANGLVETPEYKAMPQATLLKKLSQKAKEFFPEKFPTQKAKETETEDKKPSTAAVASSVVKQKKTEKKATASDLSYEQRQAGKDFVALGVYKNLDEYAQSLADSRKE